LNPLALAVYALLAPAGFLALLAAASLVGTRLTGGEFSWGRYGAWLAVALVGAVLLLAATTTWMFLIVAFLLVAWVLLRAAADAQATTLREKIGFLQLYAGLSLVEYGALHRSGALNGTHASPSFAFVLHDYLGHLALPVLSVLVGHAPVPPWAEPGSMVGGVAATLAGHWVLAAALSTFGVAAYAYAYFAEHATPNVGLSLLPVPTVMVMAFAGLWVASSVLPEGALPGSAARLAAIFLTPFFVAEGLWVLGRLARRLRTRGAWAALLAAVSLVVPGLVAALAVLGWGFYLVRLRAFEPILGDVARSASRPRLRSALGVSAGTAVVFAGLGLADAAVQGAVSPRLRSTPEVCSRIALTKATTAVVVSEPPTSFVIDTDESSVSGDSPEALVAVCTSRGARLCTSDEWYLACLCTYPNESEGGSKVLANERLVYRVESDHSQEAGVAGPDMHQLLTGTSELVGPFVPGGVVLLAGPNDGVDDAWTADCRYRGLLTRAAFRGGPRPLIGVRCCR
jgi:hypothetical protein